MRNPDRPTIIKYAVALLLTFFLASLFVFYQSNAIVLSATLESSKSTGVQVYFDRGDGFKRRNMRAAQIAAHEEKHLRFRLPANTQGIRFDPATVPGEVIIRDLKVHRSAKAAGPILAADKCLLGQNQVVLEPSKSGGIRITAEGYDPQLVLPNECIPKNWVSIRDLLPHVASQTAFSIIIVAFFSVVLSAWRRLVPFLLYTAVGVLVYQVLIVALFSRFNLHPDEISHVIASAFFQDHLFKLAVDHPDMVNAVIPGWGTSYLYLNDIVYSLAEKFTSVLTAFGLQDYLRYRLFNFLLLLMLLLVFMADRRNGIWFLLALGLTLQTWYLFAYFNGDALGMFFSFLLGYYFIAKRTEIERFFWEKPQFGAVILGFYILCVLVFFTRLHYVIFVFFILGLIFVMKLIERDFRTLMKGSIRILIFLLLVTVPVGMAKFKDQITNDFEYDTATQKIREETKRSEFGKQHIIATEENPNKRFMKNRGAPYYKLFTESPWLASSWQSFFGVYGYLNIRAPFLFYVISSFVGVGLTFIFLSVSAFRASSRFRIVVAYFFFSAFLVLIQSTMYSWLVVFQAQGRYLLAIIPMLAVVLALNPMQKTLPHLRIQCYVLMVYLVNGTGFAIYGVPPMLGFW